MSLGSLLQTYRNQGLRKQAESAKALDEFLDILWVRWNLKIDPITKSPSSTLKFYWWKLALVIQDNCLDLAACHFPPLLHSWHWPGNCRAHWRKNDTLALVPPRSTFIQLLLRYCPQNNVWHGPPKFRTDEKKWEKPSNKSSAHTSTCCCSAMTSQRSIWGLWRTSGSFPGHICEP